MSKQDMIPAPAVRRLSLYLRQLEKSDAADRRTVSSKELGESLSLSDAQVRKDLAYFGQFGQPGIGYRVPELIVKLRRILGTDRKSSVMLVGFGNLGRALLSYRGFGKQGFEVVAVLDNDPSKFGERVTLPSGRKINVTPIADMKQTIRQHGIRMAILTVPAQNAQDVADLMIKNGVRGILNFAPVTLRTAKGVAISSVDLAVQLEQLAFQMSTGS